MIDVAGYLLNDTRRHRRQRRRCLTLRGEGTRRLTTIREISPLAQSFLLAVRLQCSINVRASRGISATHTLCPCARYAKIRISSVWVSQRTIEDARFHTCTSIIVQLFGCGAALAATLPEPYRTLEVLSMGADLVYAGVGLRPNSRKNRSGL